MISHYNKDGVTKVQKGVDLESSDTKGIIPALKIVEESDFVILCLGDGRN